jgi:hypothetical protein
MLPPGTSHMYTVPVPLPPMIKLPLGCQLVHYRGDDRRDGARMPYHKVLATVELAHEGPVCARPDPASQSATWSRARATKHALDEAVHGSRRRKGAVEVEAHAHDTVGVACHVSYRHGGTPDTPVSSRIFSPVAALHT